MSVSRQSRRWATSNAPDPLMELAEQSAEDLARRWSRGERATTEEYLSRYPQLAEQPEAALELVCEEIYQQRQSGRAPDASRWLARFPQWRSQIEMLLACDALLERMGPEPQFPEPYEKFGDFQLLEQLGRGAHGRVYLALQSSLADRPLVLKLTSFGGQEHTSLARLQHTHIMPLYWAQDCPQAGLRALCMPYFGGATLAELLENLSSSPPIKRTGRDLLAALEQASTSRRLALAVEGPACQFYRGASYVEAVCSIGACLAEALDYAHQRGVVHCDLKPSNVLIAADGQPLLLDFHLAQSPLKAGAIGVSWLGGTPQYMAPEQTAALEAAQRGLPVPRAIDGRADLYALAIVLVEALAGELPPAGEHATSWLRRMNGHVGAALAAALAKCLAADPADRYPDAAALATDLRRHLSHRPLQHVKNRSLRERWTKWRKRRPYGLAAALAAAGFACWGVTESVGVRARWLGAEQALVEAQTEIGAGRFDAAEAAIARGVDLADGIPWRNGLFQAFAAARREIEAAAIAERLHRLVEAMRASYGADGLPLTDVRRLEAQARRVWDERQSLADFATHHEVAAAREVKNDLIELAILWSDLHVRSAPAGKSIPAVREALHALAEAERLAGPNCALYRAQQQLALAAGQNELACRAGDKADKLSPNSAWEHYALGRLADAAGDAEKAEAEFQAALDLDPQGLWPNYYQARAAYEHGRYEEAAAAFTVCLTLAPNAEWCFYNRGLAYLGRGNLALARRDFDRAIQLAPDSSAIAWSRGMLNYREGRYSDALTDLRRAAEKGADSAEIRYHIAASHAALGNRPAAAAELKRLFLLAPDHRDGQNLARSLEDGAR